MGTEDIRRWTCDLQESIKCESGRSMSEEYFDFVPDNWSVITVLSYKQVPKDIESDEQKVKERTFHVCPNCMGDFIKLFHNAYIDHGEREASRNGR